MSRKHLTLATDATCLPRLDTPDGVSHPNWFLRIKVKDCKIRNTEKQYYTTISVGPLVGSVRQVF